MATRFTAGMRSTGAGSATLPIGGLMGVAARDGHLVEVGVFNTTTTAFGVRIARITALGTPGSGLTEEEYVGTMEGPVFTALDTWTGAATISAASLRQASIGAAIGAGVIWTFSGEGVYMPAGTANGIGIVPVGTGQIADWYMEWTE
jgi:hypothetical protein